MKKLFTFFAAALFGMNMFAADDIVYALSSLTQEGNTYTLPTLSSAQSFKKANVYVELPNANGDGTITFFASSNTTDRFLYIYKNGGTEADESRKIDMKKDGSAIEFTSSDIMVREDSKPYLHFYTADDYKIKSFSYTCEASTSDPVLSVNPTEVTLELTAAKLADVAYVTFSGKNLEAGEYALTVPNLDGLRTDPAFVTVGEDGKLSEQVAIAYSSDVDVPLGSTEISLTIGELEAKVQVNYSASFAKNYLSKSVNIEQLVLDNGVNYDIEAEFIAADIEFANLNALDSLNDEKDYRNEPYLGLKLKKQGAYVACWLKEGDKIAVKFGAIKDAVKIGVNGEYNELPASDVSSFIERVVDKDAYLEIITKSDKTVVLKQIMLNEGIAEVILPGSPSGIEEIEAGAKAVKKVENGQLVIIKNGVKYNALGTEIK